MLYKIFDGSNPAYLWNMVKTPYGLGDFTECAAAGVPPSTACALKQFILNKKVNRIGLNSQFPPNGRPSDPAGANASNQLDFARS